MSYEDEFQIKEEKDLLCIQAAISCPSVNNIYKVSLAGTHQYTLSRVEMEMETFVYGYACVLITFCPEGPGHRI